MLQAHTQAPLITSNIFDFNIKLLKELVELPSNTKNVQGVLTVQRIIQQELEELGFSTFSYNNESEKSAPLLRGFLEGKSKEIVTLVFHADTVAPINWTHTCKLDEQSMRFYGPGVADNKGGVVMALSGLKKFLAQNNNKFCIQVICSPNEETGSNGFHHLLKKFGSESKYILGFEPALKGGGVITSRSGNKWYDISIKGLSAHSGRKAPHINAAHEISKKIAKLHKLNKFKSGVRVNVGHIQSDNDSFNIICGQVSAKVDFRFSTDRQEQINSKKIERILNNNKIKCPITKEKATTDFLVADYCPPMQPTKKNNWLKKKYLQNIHEEFESHSGGAADINHLSHAKAYCLDGLGPIGGGMHTESEYIEIEKLDKRLGLFTSLLENINDKTGDKND